METVRNFSDVYYEMEREEREEYLMGLAQLKVSGMTYKAIGGLTGFSTTALSKHLKKYEHKYKELCRVNFECLEESLTKVDPDYVYITDKRTIAQQMCALLMGGQEVIDTLEQLAGVQK
jgi:hypothetical protein